MAMKRPASAVRVAGLPAVTSDEEMSLLYPCLWQQMTETEWEDHKPRQVSTLTVFCEDGCVKLCLAERSTERSGWVSATSFNGALQVLEDKLAADTMEWRKAMRPSGRK